MEDQTTGNVSNTNEDAAQSLRKKLTDMETPGQVVEFEPQEAGLVGAFVEDAMSEEDARESAVDPDA